MSTDVLQDLLVRTRGLTDEEKVRLAIELLQQTRLGPSRPRSKWSALGGIAPGLLGGEDAQEWVARGRREDAEHRQELVQR